MTDLQAAAGFDLIDVQTQSVTLSLDMNAFVGLALSSSHAKPVIARLGSAAARSALEVIGAGLALAGGRIPYGYKFQLFVAQRKTKSPLPQA